MHDMRCGLWILSTISPEAFSYMSKWIYSTNKCKIYAIQMKRSYAWIVVIVVENAKQTRMEYTGESRNK